MKLGSYLAQRFLKLDPAATRDLIVERDLRVPMADGVELCADRWAPRHAEANLPTLVLRSPYGRDGAIAFGMARLLAERGFQVVIQSVRGTFGSGGCFDPMRQERDDGLATLDWVIKQPWFGGSIVLAGASYLGYVHWAICDSLPPQVKALIPLFTESALTLEFLRHDGLSLETPLMWGLQVDGQERRFAMLRQLVEGRKRRRALRTLPLGESDVAATGHPVPYVQDILAHDADSPRWVGFDHRDRVCQVSIPVSSVAGWYDIFLPGQLRDFRILQGRDRRHRLTVGPWTHIAFDGAPIQETVEFGTAHARGLQPARRSAVRLYVMGEEAWRDFDEWPPRGYLPQRFFLHPRGLLSTASPGESAPDRYSYNPDDPTPAVGGVRVGRGSGRAENSSLESRSDVLTYTTEVLAQDVEVIGEVSAEIWFRSSGPSADVFVRVCDVDGRGRSHNVCDGLVTLPHADQLSCATVQLWPTAYRFRRGHRIRVQVSSGAFPRYARNMGTGQPLTTATAMVISRQNVYHDARRPSAVVLPVRQ